jgi:GGDEF domain-containing protein
VPSGDQSPPRPLRLAGGPGADDAPRRDPAAHLRDLESTLRDVAASEDPLARLRQLAEEAAPPRAPDPFTAAAARLRDSAGPVIEDGTEFHAARIAPWTAAIDRRLARHRQDGLPFAVLCVELVDVDRLAAADFDGEVARALEAAEGAVCATLRPADVLVRERPGRYWLTAPDTDGPEARTLAHRVAGAVTDAPAHRDVPLQAAIGLSVCPADGSDAATLEGRAEEGVYAARAAGVRVAGSPG